MFIAKNTIFCFEIKKKYYVLDFYAPAAKCDFMFYYIFFITRETSYIILGLTFFSLFFSQN